MKFFSNKDMLGYRSFCSGLSFSTLSVEGDQFELSDKGEVEDKSHGDLVEVLKNETGGDLQMVEMVEQPAKVMRIGSMVKQLLDEVRRSKLDEQARSRLGEIYNISIKELSETLSPDLIRELERISLPFNDEAPSEAELRVAQAQLVGWLEGLFHGIQATLFAQQMALRSQMQAPGSLNSDGSAPRGELRPGTYL
jgi:hypothetical protein